MHVDYNVHLVLHDVFGQQSVIDLSATDRAPIT